MEEDDGPDITVGAGAVKFNKRPKGQLRKKRADSDEEPQASKGVVSRAENPLHVKPVAKKPAEKKSSSLSFANDEGGDADEDSFVSKKRVAAKPSELSFSKKEEREKGPAMGSYYNSGTSYSAEDLKELSKNARSLGGGGLGHKPAPTPSGGASSGDALPRKRKKDEPDVTGGVKMKGLPLAPRHPVKKEEPEDEAVPSLVRGTAFVHANKEAADELKAVLNAASSDGDGLIVPSKDQIERLKARREQARKMGVGTQGNMAKEFIPLEGSVEEQNNSKSRLVRECIEDDEDVMVTEDIGADSARITFGKGESDRQRKISAMAAAEGAVVEEDASDDEEEHRRWEQQQIRKGRGGAAMRDEFGERRGSGTTGRSGVGGLGAERGRMASGVHVRSMADVQGTLEAHQARMREQHQRDVDKLQDVTRRIESANFSLSNIEAQVHSAQKRYTFFQELRLYLQDVLECMDVKAPALEDMEDQLMDARRRRSDALRKRRSNDLSDRIAIVKESVAKASGRAAPHRETELDEFGRDPAMARERRIRERAARREKKMERRRETHAGVSGGTLLEDMWTSDESDGEVAEFKKIRAELLREERELMDDIKADYKSVTSVYARMLEWAKAFPKQYREAYVALSLPRLLAPIVRTELMDWEPLTDGKSLEQMEWVMSLFRQQELAREGAGASDLDLCTSNGGVEVGEEEDSLIPKLVEEVVVTKVKQMLSVSWDAGSMASTTRAVGLMQDVVIYILDSAPDAVQTLCAEVCTALSLELDRYIAPLALLEQGDTPAREAFQLGRWAFLQCCKLVRNAAKWREVVSPLALQKLTMDTCTSRLLLPFLQALRALHPPDAAELSKVLLDSFPDEWQERPALQPFLSFYSTLR